MRFIFYVLLFYFLYKLIFDFILPVSKASNQIRKNMRDIHTQQQQYFQQQQQQEQSRQQQQKPASNDSDYIDFEEVK